MKRQLVARIAAATAFALSAAVPAASALAAPQAADARESREIITKDNAVLILVDHQPQTIFGIASHDRQLIINNVEGLAKTAKVFGIPTILTTVSADAFTGPLIPEIRRVFPDQEVFDRSSLNAWADKRITDAVKRTGRKKLIFAGTWTELCLALPVISAVEAGYEVYFVADASGGSSVEAHQMGVQRMVQAGARPMTWIGVLSELQYDWTRQATYPGVMDIVTQHGGAWGSGINYSRSLRK